MDESSLVNLFDQLSINVNCPVLSEPSLEAVAEFIQNTDKCKHVCVLAGAGMSVSAGLPDFRTPGTGLYSQLEKYNLPTPEDIFTLNFFREQPKPFYLLAKELLPGKFKPTIAHYFVKLLHQKGLLLRHFTQNIDMLDRVAGIPEDILVEVHGNFAHAHCIDCGAEETFENVKIAINNDIVPLCAQCQGYIKPDITFFGEQLPLRVNELKHDIKRADLVLVIGTSLTVQPFASLLDLCKPTTPRVLFNRERVGPFRRKKTTRNVCVLKDIDDGIAELCELLEWTNELTALMDTYK